MFCWIIINEHRLDKLEYWSNTLGWVEWSRQASTFTDAEYNVCDVPMGGLWVQVLKFETVEVEA